MQPAILGFSGSNVSDDKAFGDTIENLLNMKPKPHKAKADDENGGEPKPTPERSEKPESDPDQGEDDTNPSGC